MIDYCPSREETRYSRAEGIENVQGLKSAVHELRAIHTYFEYEEFIRWYNLYATRTEGYKKFTKS